MFPALVLGVLAISAPTPDAAALAVYGPGAKAVVTRTNATSHYAVVFARDGSIDGERNDTPVLVEHFSFGWQPVDLVDAPCRIDALDASAADKAVLRSGVVRDEARNPCAGFRRDVGDIATVEDIRRIARGPITPFVAVSGDYALAAWYGSGGGEVLYERSGSTWTALKTGDAALSYREAIALGVPDDAARAFGFPKTFATVRTKRPERVSH